MLFPDLVGLIWILRLGVGELELGVDHSQLEQQQEEDSKMTSV